MNTINQLSDSESAVRALKNIGSECGFGFCAGDAACRDKHCPGHPCQTLTLPVVDAKFLDEYIDRHGASRDLGDMPIQFIEPEPDNFWSVRRIAAIAGGLLIAAVIYASTK